MLSFCTDRPPKANLPNLRFDTGANIGLTSATPRTQAYVGIWQRF